MKDTALEQPQNQIVSDYQQPSIMKQHLCLLVVLLNVGCVRSAQQLRSSPNQQEVDSPPYVATENTKGTALDQHAETTDYQRRLPFGPIGPNVEQEGEESQQVSSTAPVTANPIATPSVAPSAGPSPAPSLHPSATPTSDPTEFPTPDPLGPPIVFEVPRIASSDMASVMDWIKLEVIRDETAFCWREKYGRGVGLTPKKCPPGKELIGLLCYTKCPSGTSACADRTVSVVPLTHIVIRSWARRHGALWFRLPFSVSKRASRPRPLLP